MPHTSANADDTKGVRLLRTLITVNVVLVLLVGGWAVWVTADPEYWFPGAYAEKGARGDEGPRGPRGERGPLGQVGPAGPGVEDVSSTVDDLNSRVDDIEDSVHNLEGVDVYEVEQRLTDVESRVDEACSTLSLDLDTFGC